MKAPPWFYGVMAAGVAGRELSGFFVPFKIRFSRDAEGLDFKKTYISPGNFRSGAY